MVTACLGFVDAQDASDGVEGIDGTTGCGLDNTHVAVMIQ